MIGIRLEGHWMKEKSTKNKKKKTKFFKAATERREAFEELKKERAARDMFIATLRAQVESMSADVEVLRAESVPGNECAKSIGEEAN